ncbi:uncharacterized protein N7479_003788 [Penicillium vulpinum]|uniref:Uncharacterized protein n=1 Tax=Penicillium vulpinum TaxID=29845 RepID=A0A1V6RFF5_9EURO|nr:uncharacterized protein N7479_003788 [Penicillium vulpinum]KAJ5963912.1 hypothetical protein N7479_003788 [Penicillium vulpinum]OQE00525.1 hypothetical protein PENVUL_c050G10389 [Penicillium vulpinum]
MGITWNDKADAKLLAGVLALSRSPIDFEALARYMGEGVTVSAVRHRVTRLRAKAAEMAGDSGSIPAPASPVKKRQRTPKKSAKAAAAQSKDVDTESGGEGPAPKDDETDTEDVEGKKRKIEHEDSEDVSFLEDDIKDKEASFDF